MKHLFEILSEVTTLEILGGDKEIWSITANSNQVQDGSLFCAIKGTNADGHKFIEEAIEKGAVAVLCNTFPDDIFDNATYIRVDSVRDSIALLLNQYYTKVKNARLIGVTGTNGKTTVATILYQALTLLDSKVGLISTIKKVIGIEELASSLTTPGIVELYQTIDEMVEKDCEYVIMEVSSHAIDQKRINGLNFEIAVFTNLSRDHLDYHKTYKNYIYTKKKFFDNLNLKSSAIINFDDRNGRTMVQNSSAKVKSYSLRSLSDYKAKILSTDIRGMLLDIDGTQCFMRLIGEFNAMNIVASYAVLEVLGYEKNEILQVLSDCKPPKGRMQIVENSQHKNVIVDYAHSPDALENILKTIREIDSLPGEIITVVGCGGNRDKGKRPMMAKIAVSRSDKVIFTSDNPRWEDPDEILKDMMSELEEIDHRHVMRISDRETAIQTAIMLSKDKDIVLIAGKGHEDYQEIKGKKIPFDDEKIAKKYLV